MAAGRHQGTPAFAMSSAFGSTMSLAAISNGGGGILTRRALVLKNDPDGNGKYIAGLKEIRVRTRQVSHRSWYTSRHITSHEREGALILAFVYRKPWRSFNLVSERDKFSGPSPTGSPVGVMAFSL